MNLSKSKFNLVIDKLPPTDNHIYGQTGHRRFMYKEGKEWKEYVQFLALSKARSINWKMIKASVKADIVFYLKRGRDIQGSLKLLFDSLEGIVYDNDKRVVDFRVIKGYDKGKPRIEVSIEDVKRIKK